MQNLRIIGDPKTLEKLRCEYEAMLTVLTARVMVAKDLQDWVTIQAQTRAITRLAKSAVYEAARIKK